MDTLHKNLAKVNISSTVNSECLLLILSSEYCAFANVFHQYYIWYVTIQDLC